ncbi:hypothetical protein HELRODRAFT_173494 [Helobdella robusta]|uniref:Uncharacterized protein n=1 Tax=Helobdella robusta TaxID=6412 RepID=T1F6W0_HELRO|nr:hypothetical protein HELRODRAFT_173494 [Helobdella robusta]ESO03791.1 hypothetical protein HELRODRAFT_173494 [Helobdella robusta]
MESNKTNSDVLSGETSNLLNTDLIDTGAASTPSTTNYVNVTWTTGFNVWKAGDDVEDDSPGGVNETEKSIMVDDTALWIPVSNSVNTSSENGTTTSVESTSEQDHNASYLAVPQPTTTTTSTDSNVTPTKPTLSHLSSSVKEFFKRIIKMFPPWSLITGCILGVFLVLACIILMAVACKRSHSGRNCGSYIVDQNMSSRTFCAGKCTGSLCPSSKPQQHSGDNRNGLISNKTINNNAISDKHSCIDSETIHLSDRKFDSHCSKPEHLTSRQRRSKTYPRSFISWCRKNHNRTETVLEKKQLFTKGCCSSLNSYDGRLDVADSNNFSESLEQCYCNDCRTEKELPSSNINVRNGLTSASKRFGTLKPPPPPQMTSHYEASNSDFSNSPSRPNAGESSSLVAVSDYYDSPLASVDSTKVSVTLPRFNVKNAHLCRTDRTGKRRKTVFGKNNRKDKHKLSSAAVHFNRECKRPMKRLGKILYKTIEFSKIPFTHTQQLENIAARSTLFKQC